MPIDAKTGLISLAEAKLHLHIADATTTDDQLLDSKINEASLIVQKELGYNVKEQTYTEYLDGDGGCWLFLENVPVTSVRRVSMDRVDAITVTYTGGAKRATVEVTQQNVVLWVNASGVEATTTLPISDHTTVSDMADAIDATAGWGAIVGDTYNLYPAADLVPMPARSIAVSQEIELPIPDDPEDNEYELYRQEGKLYNAIGWNRGHRNIFVQYTAGLSQVPAPIKGACMELVAMLYHMSKRDMTLRAESLGDYSYTAGDGLDAVLVASGDAGAVGSIGSKLALYRRNLIYAV